MGNEGYEGQEEKISFIEAIDALSSIAEGEEGTEFTEKDILADRVVAYTEINEPLTADKVNSIFGVIFDYMNDLYSHQGGDRAMEGDLGIKSIMLLVGDAADQLDRVTNLFQKQDITSVTELSEYKKLQSFYSRKVDHKLDEGLLGKWIMGLTKAMPGPEEVRKARARKKDRSKHVFVDLEMVKKDREYELLLMRKEDGSRFFSPRLLRNIKLICDFGGYSEHGEDLFSRVEYWRDVICHVAALNILSYIQLPLRKFCQESFKKKNQDLVGALNKAVMALMVAAQSSSLKVNRPSNKKTSLHYFQDFQNYLREALTTRFYQRLLAFPPRKAHSASNAAYLLAHELCRAEYMHLNLIHELYKQVQGILVDARALAPKTSQTDDEKGVFLWSRLAYDYVEILRAFKRHQNGPLKRVLSALESGKFSAFDSLLQFNLPHSLFDLYVEDERIVSLRLPSPTRQMTINKAMVNDEFKGFLLSHGKRGEKANHLLINLQDRTSWREHSRSKVLEQLQMSETFKKQLTVVTLATDTLFYHQNGPYEDQEEAQDFISGLKIQLESPQGGYFFPDKVKSALFPKFTNNAIKLIHKFFFNSQKHLSRIERKSFIILLHLFYSIKLIDISKPGSFSLTCKDGIDLGGSMSLLLMIVIKLLQEKSLTPEEIQFVEALLYGPSILIRERAILADNLNDMLHTLQVIEGKIEELSHGKFVKEFKMTFSSLFDGDVLNAKVHIPIVEVSYKEQEAA